MDRYDLRFRSEILDGTSGRFINKLEQSPLNVCGWQGRNRDLVLAKGTRTFLSGQAVLNVQETFAAWA
jgi:hypothetical protein